MINKIMNKANNLVNQTLGVTSGLSLSYNDHWSTLVVVSLSQSNNRLDSIRLLLNKNDGESATILTRSLFELAVNLVYINVKPKDRLPEYLKHGGIPLNLDEKRKLELEFEQEQQAKDFVPKAPWEKIGNMCNELDPEWLEEYETFYRYASVPTHAGSFTLGHTLIQLRNQQPLSEHEKAVILISSLEFHLHISKIAANIFPEQINPEIIQKIISDTRSLGKTLRSSYLESCDDKYRTE